MSFLPVPDNEAERIRALRSYQILDTQSEEEFDRLTELASLICDVPISLVTFIDNDRQWIKSRRGLDISETTREVSFCQYAIMDKTIFEIPDTTTDERFKENVFVTQSPYIRFYAGFPLIDPNGYPLGTLCVLDNHAKKLNESQKKALTLLADQVTKLIVDQRKRQELRNFDKLFQLSGDLICIAGTNGYFQEINPAFGQLLGWDESFLLETSFFDLTHPDDLAKTRAEIAKLTSGEATASFVHRFRKKDGGYLFLQWTATPESVTGNIFAVARDITAEKEKEEKIRASEDNFRSFFENSQGLMCTHDLEGKFLTVNAAGAELLGYSVPEVLQLSLYDLIPVKHHPMLKRYLEEIKKTGRSNGLMTTRHKQGGYLIWSYHNILVKNQDGVDYVVGNSIDVTESHQMAKNLQRIQEMLLQTNRMARVGGWEYDLTKDKVYWSEVTREIHQVSPDYEPGVADSFSFYKEGESQNKLAKASQKAMTDGTSYDLELELTTAQGNELWVRAIGYAEFENGSCKRLYGAIQDIDEKKRAELEIVNSRKLLDDVLNAAYEVSIIATDVNGIITVFNKGAEKLLGYSGKELIGKYTPIIIHLEQELLAVENELTKEYGVPIRGFQTFVYRAELEGSDVREWTYKTKAGSFIPVSLLVTTIRDYQNQIIGYLGVATDLSARKKAERELFMERARLLAFVEHAPAAVAMFDRDIRYLAVSHKWLEEYRLTDRNIIGMTHYEVFPNIGQEWKDIHQQCLQGAILMREEERWRPPGWNHDQFLKWEVRPWYQFDGTVGGIMMFTQDVTEIVVSREELKQAKILSEQASMAKSEFLANMSHEIRTPLNGIIGFTDLVLKTKMTDTQKQYLGIVNQSANALLSIINDILDFSKIEAGKLELEIDKSDIYEIASQSSDIISFPIQSKGLEMLLNIPVDLPRFVWVDEIRLKQVLINLLSNASKFTETGEIELKIEVLKYDPSASDDITCRFEVRDTGIGIREEKQAKIFEAFLQEDSSTTKKYGGTGLGLTISNKLLGMMGSHLQLISTQGVGSTFFFDLTMRSEPGEPIVWENAEAVKKVLIVDDNDNNRMILEKMLQLLKIESDQSKNGFEALNALVSGAKYDAILIDYHMPFMDGLETIRQIRESFTLGPEQLPIVLLNSSADDSRVLKACEEFKVNYRLMKPVKLTDISLCLTRLAQKEKEEGDNETLLALDNHGVNAERITVLIAEDNPVNMFLAKTIIGKIAPNAVILEAENGVEAAEFCRKQLPDIIFMDVQMPEMNGYEATAAIRNLAGAEQIPVIALTAGNVKGERDKCLEAGMNDFISKPFVEEAIWQVFNKFPGLLKTTSPQDKTFTQSPLTDMHIDVDRLKDTYMNDEEFITEFLALTRETLYKSMSELKAYHQQKDLKNIKATGHKLKGAASAAFLSEVTRIADKLEHLDFLDQPYITLLLSDLENEITYLLPALHSPRLK
ncbi:Sensor histidine kinase RcsC [Dyadobacter sp. CECT 9275]|uniref:Sensory/regulatory protein RpfC n=1 Tax=Dyadobacter helix TaxID=2822344 RepID=A0A916JH16_9BACT|nr:PAS domain S-box protein [Dyadobacter sp. CECT 9275]CAG5010358.1 Sensor histidine kinase RcsC [Dyadobacter sp. CECT 9275]